MTLVGFRIYGHAGAFIGVHSVRLGNCTDCLHGNPISTFFKTGPTAHFQKVPRQNRLPRLSILATTRKLDELKNPPRVDRN